MIDEWIVENPFHGRISYTQLGIPGRRYTTMGEKHLNSFGEAQLWGIECIWIGKTDDSKQLQFIYNSLFMNIYKQTVDFHHPLSVISAPWIPNRIPLVTPSEGKSLQMVLAGK